MLDADGLLFGFASATSELNPDDKTRQPDAGAQAKVVVMQFADEAAATKAAADLEAADFKVAADINQPVSLPKYSAAHTHWRPGIATAGSFLAHGAYVLHTMAGLKDADLGQLTDLLQKIYDAQLPLLDQLKPLDREGILRLPNDPDGMLRQTLNPDGFGLPDNDTQITSTARGFLHRVADQAHWEKVMSDAGVDRFSLSGFDFDGPSMVFRARDPRSARALASTILDPAYPGAAEAPAQVPDVVCGESPPWATASARRSATAARSPTADSWRRWTPIRSPTSISARPRSTRYWRTAPGSHRGAGRYGRYRPPVRHPCDLPLECRLSPHGSTHWSEVPILG